MRLNRFVGLAAIALLVVGAMGAVAALAFAQPPLQAQTRAAPPARQAAQSRQTAAQANQVPLSQATQPAAEPTEARTILEAGTKTETAADSITETTSTTTEPITDTVASGPNDQAGDQVGTDGGGQADQGPNDQSPKLNGSITVTQTASTDGETETAEAAGLAGLAKITVDQAKAAALAANVGTTLVKTTLDNENGALVYSVELSNGSDVKVDAGSGLILATDAGGAEPAGSDTGGVEADSTDSGNQTQQP